MAQRSYYQAYDDRYRQVHSRNLRWFSSESSPVVVSVLQNFAVGKKARILEIGCGEGRDSFALLEQGYDLLATDVSGEAIRFCREKRPEYAERFQVLDCLTQRLEARFDFIFAVSVVHMLVEDRDRQAFYAFFRNHLDQNGIGLIVSMGDGKTERSSDITGAFTLQERVHEETGTVLQIAGTSYRAVSFDTFRREITAGGLEIKQDGLAVIAPDYNQVMYAVVKKHEKYFEKKKNNA